MYRVSVDIFPLLSPLVFTNQCVHGANYVDIFSTDPTKSKHDIK